MRILGHTNLTWTDINRACQHRLTVEARLITGSCSSCRSQPVAWLGSDELDGPKDSRKRCAGQHLIGVARMAVEGRINVRHEDVFTQPVLLLSVDPVEDFDKKRAGAGDPQDRDKQTGMRLWAVSVLDPTAPQGRREIKVKIAADVQPVPANGLMPPVEFEGLQVIPASPSPPGRPGSGRFGRPPKPPDPHLTPLAGRFHLAPGPPARPQQHPIRPAGRLQADHVPRRHLAHLPAHRGHPGGRGRAERSGCRRPARPRQGVDDPGSLFRPETGQDRRGRRPGAMQQPTKRATKNVATIFRRSATRPLTCGYCSSNWT